MFTYNKPDNLVDLFESSVNRFSNNNLFGVRNEEATALNWITYGEAGKKVDNIRSGLSQAGIEQGDFVGFIGNNRPEWAYAAFAAYGLGAHFVPMYESELLDVWKYIIEDADVKVLIVSKTAIYEKIKGFLNDLPKLEKIIDIESQDKNGLSALEKSGEAKPVASMKPSPYDLAGLIYTSGTTGAPKGVLLSHGNLTSNAQSGYHLYPELNESSRSISLLPWAHSYGQSAELNNFLQFGGSIGFVEDVTTFARDLKLVQPTFMIAVPRVFNKIYDQVHSKMEEKGGMIKKLFHSAVETARKHQALSEQGKSSLPVNLKLALFDRLVFSKIRDQFGGSLTGALSGSATMNIEIAHFFGYVGIPVFDCYGLSETSPAVTMNCRGDHRLGSVGKCLENVRIEIDRTHVEEGAIDGEIIVYGPNVMQGYHKKPEETQKVMTDTGGFRTGDRGRLDEDGYLYITGRIKEQYKLENGKYVFPAAIEEEIKLMPLIANAMIYGDARSYNVCLIVPDFQILGKLAAEHKLNEDPESLVTHPLINELMAAEIRMHLEGKFGHYEIPKRFKLITEDFSLENGMLTQTMKLKRQSVLKSYKDDIEAMYH